GPLHRPPTALDLRAALRGQRAHLRRLQHPSERRPGSAARRSQPEPRRDRGDQPAVRPRQAALRAVLQLHEGPGPSLRLPALVHQRRAGARPHPRPPPGHHPARQRRGVHLAARRPLDRDDLGGPPRLDHRPRLDGPRARRDLRAGLLARPDLALPLLRGPGEVPALPGLGRVRQRHELPRARPGDDHALARPLDGVRGDLRAAASLQPARGAVGGLHPHGAGQGPVRAAGDLPARRALGGHPDRHHPRHRRRRAARRRDPHGERLQRPRDRPAGVRRHRARGSGHNPGHRALPGPRRVADDPPGGHHLRLPRPAGALL
ncbi:MAG: Dipeptide transport system permease protein DppB, partial [uncultured Solirubrobacteraceae bacterium]